MIAETIGFLLRNLPAVLLVTALAVAALRHGHGNIRLADSGLCAGYRLLRSSTKIGGISLTAINKEGSADHACTATTGI